VESPSLAARAGDMPTAFSKQVISASILPFPLLLALALALALALLLVFSCGPQSTGRALHCLDSVPFVTITSVFAKKSFGSML
jgi:hypothetical protein